MDSVTRNGSVCHGVRWRIYGFHVSDYMRTTEHITAFGNSRTVFEALKSVSEIKFIINEERISAKTCQWSLDLLFYCRGKAKVT